MKLRTSKVLKILAILLFSMESLAPSFLSTTYAPLESAKFSSVDRTFTNQILLLSLYTEVFDTEERVEVGGKEIILLADQPGDEYALRFPYKLLSHSFLQSQQGRLAFKGLLFELHCTYLI